MYTKGAQSLYQEVDLMSFIIWIHLSNIYSGLWKCKEIFFCRILWALTASESFSFWKKMHLFYNSTPMMVRRDPGKLFITLECIQVLQGMEEQKLKICSWMIFWRTTDLRKEKQNQWFICGEYSNENDRTVQDVKIILVLGHSKPETSVFLISLNIKIPVLNHTQVVSSLLPSLLPLTMGTQFGKSVRNKADRK